MSAGLLYEFTKDDFVQVLKDPRFSNSIKLAIELSFFPKMDVFNIEPSFLQELCNTQRSELYDKVRDNPLPLLVFMENPDKLIEENKLNIEKAEMNYKQCLEVYTEEEPYFSKQNLEESLITLKFYKENDYSKFYEDIKLQKYLLEKSLDNTCPEWYCYTHNCDTVAYVIMYAILKILYPQENFYLYQGLYHYCLINRPIDEYSLNPEDYKERRFSRDLSQPLIFDLIGQCIPDKTPQWLFEPFEGYPKVFYKDLAQSYIKDNYYQGIEKSGIIEFYQMFE
jgi:hypothetical protein